MVHRVLLLVLEATLRGSWAAKISLVFFRKHTITLFFCTIYGIEPLCQAKNDQILERRCDVPFHFGDLVRCLLGTLCRMG